jgi:hypothetical protein
VICYFRRPQISGPNVDLVCGQRVHKGALNHQQRVTLLRACITTSFALSLWRNAFYNYFFHSDLVRRYKKGQDPTECRLCSTIFSNQFIFICILCYGQIASLERFERFHRRAAQIPRWENYLCVELKHCLPCSKTLHSINLIRKWPPPGGETCQELHIRLRQ